MKGGLQVYNEQAKFTEGQIMSGVRVVGWPCVSGVRSMVSMFRPTIKPFIIARKTLLLTNASKSVFGNAIMFSMIQMAIENDLDLYKYLTWLMKSAKDADLAQEYMIQTLLLWNAPAECHTK